MTATSQRPLAEAPALLALDWGTSTLRAYLMTATGAVLDMRHAPRGILHLPVPRDAGGFEQAFAEIARDWLGDFPTLRVVAGGMVGSAQGWIEAPYAPVPADVRTLAAHGVRVPSGLGPDILIAPGVIFDAPDRSPDVMRGEEIQIAGALAAEPSLAERTCFVLPGTHSKWVLVEEQRIVSFATHMTGELYAVLREHSILGRLMSTEPVDPDASARAFGQGLHAARESSPGDLPHQLFATRALGLTKRLPNNALADYLSGCSWDTSSCPDSRHRERHVRPARHSCSSVMPPSAGATRALCRLSTLPCMQCSRMPRRSAYGSSLARQDSSSS